MTNKRTVEDLAESIAHADGECVFLIGAGFSYSADIPLAGELVEEIKIKFPRAYARADSDEYNCVMGELTPHQRAKLLTDYIDKAKVNWAHLLLAQLFEADKIDRILTVNFDPLVVKACSMVGEFPAVYDLATATEFKESRISPKSVFYLNGQHTGFAMLNSDDEFISHKARLSDIVKNTGSRRIWVVVGYSGEADPLADVLNVMAQASGFDNGLYWVGHSENPNAVQTKLLENNDTFYIGNQDADKFMNELVRLLSDETDSLIPKVLTNPFDHIESTLTKNIDFSTGGQYAEKLYDRLSTLLQQARLDSEGEEKGSTRIPDLSKLILSGKYDKVFELWSRHGDAFTENQKSDVAWAYVMAANDFSDKARAIADKELSKSISLWSEAGTNYQQSLKIKPNMHEALYNWGIALSYQANTIVNTNPVEAKELWAQASDKFEQALEIKPDKHAALYNWGIALSDQAKAIVSTDPEAAKELWSQASDKYEQALEIKPDKHAALNNWGIALSAQANTIVNAYSLEAKGLWAQASDKYEQALAIDPDKHEALNNWGVALSDQANAIVSTDPEEAKKLWAQASDKYEQALEIKPDKHAALNNWGSTLDDQAQALASSDIKLAQQLWSEACDKYEQALTIKPDKQDALNNWGVALDYQAQAVASIDLKLAQRLWSEAYDKFEQVLKIKPDDHEALNNWGVALNYQAEALPSSDLKLAQKLWSEAYDKYEQALKIKPDKHEALSNWAGSLSEEYHFVRNSDPDRSKELLDKAGELLERGVKLAPGIFAYNYACYCSNKGDPEQSVNWLKTAKEHQKLPNKQHIDEDKDFDNIRESQVFIDWYESEFGNHVD